MVMGALSKVGPSRAFDARRRGNGVLSDHDSGAEVCAWGPVRLMAMTEFRQKTTAGLESPAAWPGILLF
jgi:hypothetical protein